MAVELSEAVDAAKKVAEGEIKSCEGDTICQKCCAQDLANLKESVRILEFGIAKREASIAKNNENQKQLGATNKEIKKKGGNQ